MKRVFLLLSTLIVIMLTGCSGPAQPPVATPSSPAAGSAPASPTASSPTSPTAPSPGVSLPNTPSPARPSTDSPTPASPSPAGLTIVVNDGSGTTTTWTLTCEPPGGDHPDPAAACTALDTNGATALPAVAKGKKCTQVYGGAQTATITGTWRGESVNSTLKRTNGCEIGRWTALKGLLPGGAN